MALVLKDRVKQTASAPGTGTITLSGSVAGFQSFSAVGNGNTTYFAIVDSASGAWEVNYGTYTSSGTTLSRNATPLSSSAAGALVNFTGTVDVFCTYPSSRSVYLDAAGSAVTTLDIGTLGTSTANITTANITSGTVTTTPTNNTDIVNKQYADAIASGIHFHEAVGYATTAALPACTYNNGTSGVGATLTANANGALTVDSYTFTSPTDNGTRILIKNQADAAQNGVYTLSQAGNSSPGAPFILVRATDFDTAGSGVDQIDEGDFFLVTSGTANANTAWVQQTPPPIVVGTTAIVFQQFAAPITYTAGTGLNESPAFTFNIANTTVSANTYGSASAVPVFAVNAQGQLTSVTNTSIAINGSAVTGNITGSAGSVANALTLGTYLTGTSFNGSAAVTATVDATSANTASKVVARDASGDFSAGTITATLSGSSTSATTATNLAGGTANQIPYQTSAGTTSFITAASGTNYVLNYTGSAFSWVAGTISGVSLGSNLNALTAGTYLTSGGTYDGATARTFAVDATDANTASKVVARDASGNFSAGTITAALSGNATTATTATNVSGTVAVANGGTGATTLAGANIPVVNVANTFTGTNTFTGSSSATAIVLNDAAEVTTVSATAATGTINYDITTQSVLYYTSNASANWTVNFRGSSGTSLNTLMSTGQSMTVAFLVTQGSTAYYNSAVQVDGTTSGVTTRWLGGAPTAGNASGIDSYRYLIIKTGSATFTVLASNTQFKA